MLRTFSGFKAKKGYEHNETSLSVDVLIKKSVRVMICITSYSHLLFVNKKKTKEEHSCKK